MWPVKRLIPSLRYLANTCCEAIHRVLIPIPDLLNRSHVVEISLWTINFLKVFLHSELLRFIYHCMSVCAKFVSWTKLCFLLNPHRIDLSMETSLLDGDNFIFCYFFFGLCLDA